LDVGGEDHRDDGGEIHLKPAREGLRFTVELPIAASSIGA